MRRDLEKMLLRVPGSGDLRPRIFGRDRDKNNAHTRLLAGF